MKKLSTIQQIQNRLSDGWVPFEFWGYTTIVMERSHSVSDDPGGFSHLRDLLLTQFEKAGIPARQDNKIVFAFKKGTELLYVGFYDWHVDVGSSIRPDSWLKPSRKAE